MTRLCRAPHARLHPAADHQPRLLATNTSRDHRLFDALPAGRSSRGIADPFGRLAAFPVTLDANGRTIEGARPRCSTRTARFQEWFYRADTGNWVKLTSLLSTDDNPFPNDFDIFSSAGLAMRLNPRFGREMDPQTATVYQGERRQFVARYLQSACRFRSMTVFRGPSCRGRASINSGIFE
jgi:hypothetical protein